MGRTSSLLVHPTGSGWIRDEDAPRSAVDLARLGGEGPSIAAQVLHSDVCFVVGRAPGAGEWRWVFGEAAASSYVDEFDPSEWIDIADPDALEDSREQRVTAAAAAAISWATTAGLEPVEPREVRKVLAAGYVFAEDGFSALLDCLGVDASMGRQPSAEPDHVADPAPGRQAKHDPPRAIAIDHSSPDWADIDAYFLESRFGEPPCILHWEHNDYVLSDPPVCLGGGGEWDGQWVDVPAEHASDFMAAAAWARANVGRIGKPPTGTRPLLVLDDPPPSLQGWKVLPLWFLHGRADHAQVAVCLEVEDSLDGDIAAELATNFHDRLVTRVVAAFGESATTTYGGEEAPRGGGLVVGGLTMRHDGLIGVTKATEASWRQVVAKLRTSALVGVKCSVTRTDANGQANMEPFSNMKAAFAIWDEVDYEDVDTSGRIVKVSVDLPYFGSTFGPADAEAFARSALTELPLRRGYVHVGRWADSTDHWIDVLPADEAPGGDDNYAVIEKHGHLVWLQRTVTPPTPVVEI